MQKTEKPIFAYLGLLLKKPQVWSLSPTSILPLIRDDHCFINLDECVNQH